MRRSLLLALALAALLPACTVPGDDFVPNAEEPGETLAIVVDVAGSLSLDEGKTATIAVSLSEAPSAPVTVSVAPSSSALTVDKTSLTFTADDFSRPQTVTVTAAEDDDLRPDTARVSLRIEARAITTPVSVAIADNDTQALQLSMNKLTLDEEGSTQITARLAFEPVNPVVAAVRSSNDGLVTDTDKVTFTADNWKTPQPIALRAPKDDDTTSETGQLRVATDDNTLVALVDTTVRDVVSRAQEGYFDATIQTEWSHPRFDVIPVTLAKPLTVDRVLLNSLTDMEHGARMALYTDGGGKPGTLLVKSPDIKLVKTSWPKNFTMSAAPITATPLAAGTYWLAVQFNGHPADGATPEQFVKGTYGDGGYGPGCSVDATEFGGPFPTGGWTCIEKMVRFTMAIEGDRRVAPN